MVKHKIKKQKISKIVSLIIVFSLSLVGVICGCAYFQRECCGEKNYFFLFKCRKKFKINKEEIIEDLPT